MWNAIGIVQKSSSSITNSLSSMKMLLIKTSMCINSGLLYICLLACVHIVNISLAIGLAIITIHFILLKRNLNLLLSTSLFDDHYYYYHYQLYHHHHKLGKNF